jgi:hypothetical protein
MDCEECSAFPHYIVNRVGDAILEDKKVISSPYFYLMKEEFDFSSR